jgi:hypothetical protein
MNIAYAAWTALVLTVTLLSVVKRLPTARIAAGPSIYRDPPVSHAVEDRQAPLLVRYQMSEAITRS